MMIHIPLPEGLKLPENAESEPFTAEVEFLAMDGMLMPVSIAGVPIAQEEPEMEEGGEYEEGGEMEGEMEGEGGGGEGGGGFMAAIEQALAQPKR
jgi:hypothetical protein